MVVLAAAVAMLALVVVLGVVVLGRVVMVLSVVVVLGVVVLGVVVALDYWRRLSKHLRPLSHIKPSM